jgi:NAD(P)-dependent dehydrogenase (short-subunit alcohol dehydrogenase family)
LGQAFVADLRRCGALVLASGRRGGDLRVDVTEPDSGERLVAAALDRYGRLDAVVAAAGVAGRGLAHKLSQEDFRRTLEVDLFGVAHVVLPAYRQLRAAGGGRIVVVTSTAGLYGNVGLLGYATSKAALTGMVRTLALEGAAHGVVVNALAPYATTAMTEAYLTSHLAPEAVAPVLSWLVAPSCPLSGALVVTGGGHTRRAYIVEGPAVGLDELDTLVTPDVVEFAGADAAFADLVPQ